jgi:hypothetical protein
MVLKMGRVRRACKAGKLEGAEMTQESKRRQFRSSIKLSGRLVAAIMVLTAAFLFPLAHAKEKPKDNPEDFTRVYAFTYDEVFQAANDALFRAGQHIKVSDKDKGLLSAFTYFPGLGAHCTIDVRIESISAKPETRVTYKVFECDKLPRQHKWGPASNYASGFFSSLQKVLATYK